MCILLRNATDEIVSQTTELWSKPIPREAIYALCHCIEGNRLVGYRHSENGLYITPINPARNVQMLDICKRGLFLKMMSDRELSEFIFLTNY